MSIIYHIEIFSKYLMNFYLSAVNGKMTEQLKSRLMIFIQQENPAKQRRRSFEIFVRYKYLHLSVERKYNTEWKILRTGISILCLKTSLVSPFS